MNSFVKRKQNSSILRVGCYSGDMHISAAFMWGGNVGVNVGMTSANDFHLQEGGSEYLCRTNLFPLQERGSEYLCRTNHFPLQGGGLGRGLNIILPNSTNKLVMLNLFQHLPIGQTLKRVQGDRGKGGSVW